MVFYVTCVNTCRSFTFYAAPSWEVRSLPMVTNNHFISSSFSVDALATSLRRVEIL